MALSFHVAAPCCGCLSNTNFQPFVCCRTGGADSGNGCIMGNFSLRRLWIIFVMTMIMLAHLKFLQSPDRMTTNLTPLSRSSPKVPRIRYSRGSSAACVWSVWSGFAAKKIHDGLFMLCFWIKVISSYLQHEIDARVGTRAFSSRRGILPQCGRGRRLFV